MNMSVYSYMANNKKKWRAVYRYTDFTGKRRQTQKRGFNTKREAEFWLENKKKAENGQLNMTFGSFYEIYERDKKARVKETTFETKSYVARDKILPYFKDRRMDEIKPKDVMEWQNELLNYRNEKGEPYSSGYLRTIHAQLSAIFNFAKRYYGLSTNPAAIVGTMKNDVEKEVEIWTKEEYLKFSEAVMDKPLSFYAFEVLYWTGVREGELLALTPADFDFENNTMRINKNYQKVKGREIITSPKTKKSNRVVKIPQFLADEINRTSPKTQSALLEVMEEGTVTIDAVKREVPQPFMVIATENPTGSSGTQLLPESQLDRFMVRMSLGYPSQADEISMMKSKKEYSVDDIPASLTVEDILEMKKEVEKVFIHDLIYQYTTDLVNATRKHQYLTLGVSPRGTLALINMASAHAYLQERDYVVPADVAAVFTDVCAHRLILNTKAKVGGLTAEGILEQILKLIPQPKAK